MVAISDGLSPEEVAEIGARIPPIDIGVIRFFTNVEKNQPKAGGASEDLTEHQISVQNGQSARQAAAGKTADRYGRNSGANIRMPPPETQKAV